MAVRLVRVRLDFLVATNAPGNGCWLFSGEQIGDAITNGIRSLADLTAEGVSTELMPGARAELTLVNWKKPRKPRKGKRK